jgi:DNA polymerase V
VVATVNGDSVAKRLKIEGGRIYFMPENPKYKPIEVGEGMQAEVWGIVTWVVHKV